MFDITTYLLFPDQTFVVFLHRWFQVVQWYYIYPLAMLHTSAWVLLKVGLIHGATTFVQQRVARHRVESTSGVVMDTHSHPFLRWVRAGIVKFAHQTYISAKKLAHGKSVSGYSLFWIGLTPLLQKLGDAIIGIRWGRFGWRGALSLCLGSSLQAGCFCLLYSIYGKDQAEQIMLWIMLPLGILVLLTWMIKNGRTKSA